ncbi:conserved hypothetical protein [Burkholderia vietnamiensis]|nr:conserved hypothetical protein [Burkholderia vietnamiensis]
MTSASWGIADARPLRQHLRVLKAPMSYARHIGAVRDAAQAFGLSHLDIVSGAGHDACHAARAVRRRSRPQRGRRDHSGMVDGRRQRAAASGAAKRP